MGYLLVWILFFVLALPAHAAFSFNIDSIDPTTVSSKEQTVTVQISLANLPAGDSYLRLSWQESDNKPYFGYMQNNAGDWVFIQPLSGDCTKYYKVSSVTTVATLSAKIGEDTDINPGTYTLKAHKFTPACSYSSITPTASILVAIPTATPTPAPTGTPTPTPTPTSTPTPRPTATPLAKPDPAPQDTPTPTIIITATPSATLFAIPSGTVLGDNHGATCFFKIL